MDRAFLVIILPLALVIIGGGLWFFHGQGTAMAPSGQATTTTLGYSTTDVPSDTPAAQTTPNQPANPTQTAPAPTTTTNQNIMQATLHTSMGDITIEFDKAAAPNTVANFIKLASSGFYDGTKFHRVIAGFMDQAGDPLTKDDSQAARWGTGGPGYTIADENVSAHNAAGVVTMANTGAPNSGGSQFFINAVDNGFLDGSYSVFGKVTSGMDVVTAINKTPTGANDRPVTPVVIKSVTLQ